MLAREFCVASLQLASRLAALSLLAAAAAATIVSSDLIVYSEIYSSEAARYLLTGTRKLLKAVRRQLL
jgi:hypothetical protein